MNNPRRWPHTGVILAGGDSQRMGTPKEGLLLSDQRPVLAHILETMLLVSQTVAVVGRCQGYDLRQHPTVKHLEDICPGYGPISGLHSVLNQLCDTAYLVVTCDQPFLSMALLQHLLENTDPSEIVLFRSETPHKMDPFPGHYPARLKERVNDALGHKQFSLQGLLKHDPNTRWVDCPQERRWERTGLNTPEEFHHALSIGYRLASVP